MPEWLGFKACLHPTVHNSVVKHVNSKQQAFECMTDGYLYASQLHLSEGGFAAKGSLKHMQLAEVRILELLLD